MLRISLRSLLAHKLRLVLTALAVILGVAFASGMLMLTAALDRTFTDIFEGSAQDVLVSPRPAVEADITTDTGAAAPLLLPQEDVDSVAALPEVSAAAGAIQQNGAYLLDSEGEVVGAVGPPALGVDWIGDPELALATIVEGRAPEADLEVAVDQTTFPKLGLQLGDQLSVLTPGGQIETTLVGTFRFGDTGGLAGATLTAFVPTTAQELFAEPGYWQFISVATAEGFTDDEAAAAIEAVLGDDYLVQTRAEYVAEQSRQLQEGLAFLDYILLGFAGIALFVAAFLIYNTFSMLIAQRSKEMALLRAIGATRRQVLGAVLAEAVLLGLFAALVGVVVGYALAVLLAAGVGALGLDLTAGIQPTPDAIVAAVVIGLAVTVLSAVVPAVHAASIRPIAALREAGAPPERPGVVRTILGFLVLLIAGFLLGQAFAAVEPNIGSTALGALLLLTSGILLAPLLARIFALIVTPLLSAIGGVPGRLAGRNTARSPRRVAATASALIVGLALVSAVTVVVASAKSSIEDLVDRAFGAELVVATQTGQPFATTIAEEIETIDGVDYVMRIGTGPVSIAGDQQAVTAVGGGPLESAFSLEATAGDLTEFGPGTALVSDDYAEANGLAVGDALAALFPSGEERDFPVVAVYETSALLTGPVIPIEDYREVGGAAQDTTLFVDIAEGADAAAVQAEVETAAAANPLVVVYDQTGIKDQNSATLDQLLYIIYAMLGLSVIIAALGVVNTMFLSVVERTREIGMLRAVGSSRRQVRRMIRWEAVMVALLGGLVGIGIGVIAAMGLQQALASSGIDQLVIPSGTVAVLIVAALIIGVVGAAIPARRAARLDILESIATE